MADVKWIKVSTDMFESSRKIKQIEVMPEGDTILVIWLKLLLLAGNVNDGGNIYITPEIPYTDEMLANELRRPLATVRMALSIFEKFGMIEIIDDILRLSSWEKYQNIEGLEKIREQNRKRVAKCREKKLLSSGSVTSNVTVTLRNGIEGDGDKDKEKEFHSFTHTRESEDDLSSPEYRRSYLGGIGKNVVFLSDEQMSDLLDKLSVEEFDYYVGVIADNELKGHHYKKKTHYQAILDMAKKDRATR
jgi:predicted phage replisome organizer